MIRRRDLLIGGACVAAAVGAEAPRPRKHVSLLGSAKMKDIVPSTLPDWSAVEADNLVEPEGLAAKLYGETVARTYTSATTGAQVMMLLAYGDTQSDQLQLHRPENCYPAFGYTLSHNVPFDLKLAKTVDITARQIVADAPGHREIIVYWSRLGEFLPSSGGDQRMDRLKTAMDGIVADGLLARFSMINDDTPAAVGILQGFISSLLLAVPAAHRRALIGTAPATALNAASA